MGLRMVLASASPARAALLRQIGLRFEVIPSRIYEDNSTSGDPSRNVIALARAKAHHVAESEPDSVVIAADTVVVLDDMVLGKPENAHQARDMLQHLSGRWHQVTTGVAVVNVDGQSSACCEVTDVRMRALSTEIIDAYVSSGEPLGKAGAYAIQGRGALLVESVKGCYFNVVGLPLARLAELCSGIGIDIAHEVFRG